MALLQLIIAVVNTEKGQERGTKSFHRFEEFLLCQEQHTMLHMLYELYGSYFLSKRLMTVKYLLQFNLIIFLTGDFNTVCVLLSSPRQSAERARAVTNCHNLRKDLQQFIFGQNSESNYRCGKGPLREKNREIPALIKCFQKSKRIVRRTAGIQNTALYPVLL